MRKGEHTRATILKQAVAVASIEGLDRLSIGSLASLTGLSKSGLFGHFGSKEALQRGVLETVVDDFIAKVIAPAVRKPTGLERLEALVKLWLDWSSADAWSGGCPLQAASFELDDRPGPLRDYLVEQQAGWLSSIARMATRAIKDGDFRKDLDVELFAFQFQSIGLGYSYSARLMHDPKARQHAEQSFEPLIQSARA